MEHSEQEDQYLAGLLAAAASGDETALAALYDRTSPRVFGLVSKILRDSAQAEEVTLDVYLQVWKTAGQYQAERGSPSVWIATLARRRAIDRWRSLRAERGLLVEDFPLEECLVSEAEAPDEEVARDRRAHSVRAALAQLRPEHRAVLQLAYFTGLSQSEIAERLGMPLGSVKTHARNALIELRALLEPLRSEVRND